MEKNYSSTEQPAVSDAALSLPHFDEDATLLSARPVVPLHEVKAETRSRRNVIFGLTIVSAILVGATSATFLLMRNGQNSESAAEAEISLPTVSSSGAAGGTSSEPAQASLPLTSKQAGEPQTLEVPSARDSTTRKRPTATTSRSSVRPAEDDRPESGTDEVFENDDRELRRAERRDARREARRELRRRRERIGDDLLRIREIFEGSPRP